MSFAEQAQAAALTARVEALEREVTELKTLLRQGVDNARMASRQTLSLKKDAA